mgnify:CR=1 FL=1
MQRYLYENFHCMRYLLRAPLLLYMVLLSFICEGQTYDTTIQPADVQPANYTPLLAGKRVALIINQTSKVGGRSLLDILIGQNVNVTKIFVPEHGLSLIHI